MNIERLLYIAQEADKIGDYTTADKVDNLLKTAQINSLMPAMPDMPQASLQAQQNNRVPGLTQIEKNVNLNLTGQPISQNGVYYAPMAPGATYYTPGVVNIAQPQMTEEQKAFADLRGLRGQVQQADQVVKKQNLQPRQYPIYQTYQQPVFQGTNTQEQHNSNSNAPVNPKLYGTGYASMAMAPQQPTTQNQSNQNTNSYSYNQNYNTPVYQNYNNAYMQKQQQQQSFPKANHSGDFYFESDNGGPIDQSMNVALGTQNNSAKYKDGPFNSPGNTEINYWEK